MQESWDYAKRIEISNTEKHCAVKLWENSSDYAHHIFPRHFFILHSEQKHAYARNKSASLCNRVFWEHGWYDATCTCGHAATTKNQWSATTVLTESERRNGFLWKKSLSFALCLQKHLQMFYFQLFLWQVLCRVLDFSGHNWPKKIVSKPFRVWVVSEGFDYLPFVMESLGFFSEGGSH